VTDYVFVLREGDTVEVVHDRHVHGLFPRERWLDGLRRTGFEATSIPWDHSDVEDAMEMFHARRPIGTDA
jgi:hypothetical protein